MKKLYILIFNFIFLSSVNLILAQKNADFVESHYTNDNVKSLDGKVYSLSTFKDENIKVVIPENVLSKVNQSDLSHHDFGKYTHPQNDKAVELINLRSEFQSAYLTPEGKTIFTASKDPLNFVNGRGEYVRIETGLNSSPYYGSIYRASNRPNPVKINKLNAQTSFEILEGDIHINQNPTLKFNKWNGATIASAEMNISNSTIGKDGMFVADLFPGIDMQTILLKNNKVKTNYIIKNRENLITSANEVIFEDILTLPDGFRLEKDLANGMESGQNEDWDGDLIVYDNEGRARFHYSAPLIYDNNYTKELIKAPKLSYDEASESVIQEGIQSNSYTYASYRLQKLSDIEYKVAVVVKSEWLLDAEREYPVVIDPTTFTSTALDLSSLCAVTMSGTTPADDPLDVYGPTGCHTTSVTLPAGYMLTNPAYPSNVSATYINNGCAMSNTFMTFYGPCGKAPRAEGFFYFCNSTFAGTCTGEEIPIDPLLSRCNFSNDGELCDVASAPSCSDQTLDFTVCVQTRCSGGTAGSCHPNGTANGNVQLSGDFVVNIFADKIETAISSPAGNTGVNVCPAPQTLDATTIYGVPAGLDANNCSDDMGGTYNHTWTQIAGPTAGIPISTPTAASTTVDLTGADPGTYTFQVTACNTGCTSPAATMCDVRTFDFVVGAAIAPIVDSAFFCGGISNAIPINNPQGGYTYTWYNASNAVVGTGTSYTPPAQPDGTVLTYTVQATAPCNSEIETLTVTWAPISDPVAQNAQICPDNSATLLANCGGNCDWYDAAAGGALLQGSSGSYTTPSLTTTTTYYVEYNAGGGCISARVPVDVNVGALSVTTNPDTTIILCGEGETIDLTSFWSGGSSVNNITVTNSTATGNVTDDGDACTSPTDAGCATVSSSITSPASLDNPLLANSIQSICVEIPNGCPRDVQLWIEDPEGTIYTLASTKVNTNQPYTPCFTIDATQPIPGMGGGAATGSYVPDGGALSSMFTGVDPYAGTGTWTVYVGDARAGGGCSNAISLQSWSITFQTTPPTQFDWSGGDVSLLGSTSDSITTFTAPAGNYNQTYTVQITDATGCVGDNTVNIECTTLSAIDYKISGKSTIHGNLLSWAVTNDDKEVKFNVEKLINNEFKSISNHTYNDNKNNEISFLDNNITNNHTYRVKYLTPQGVSGYSNTLKLENKSVNSLSVNPNPAKDLVIVTFASNLEVKKSLKVFGIAGNLLLDIELDINEGLKSHSIDVSDLESGVYYIVSEDKYGFYKTRFIKQ